MNVSTVFQFVPSFFTMAVVLALELLATTVIVPVVSRAIDRRKALVSGKRG